MRLRLGAIIAVLLLTLPAQVAAAKPESKANPATAGKILSQQDKTQPTQRQLIEFYEHELAESERRGNWEAIARRLALDFLEIAADGKVYDARQVAEYFPQVQLHSYRLSEWEFRSLGTKAALVAYRSDVDASFKGQRLPAAFRVSSVWVRRTGVWLLKFHQATPVPKQSPLARRQILSPAEADAAEQEQKQSMPERKLIESYEREMLDADKKGDWDTISRHMADDFLEIAGDGGYYDKQQIAKLFPESRVTDYRLSEVEFRALGPNAAVLAYRLDVHATFRGTALPAMFRVSSVWRKRAGVWKVIFHQGTPIPAEGAAKH